jgi:hypothetical protein
VLEVEIAGMFALVPSVDQSMVRIVGARADGGHGHGGLAHRAHLQVPCEVLADPSLQNHCLKRTGGWEAVEYSKLPQGYSLQAGFDLRVDPGGAGQGVVRSVVLGDYLVDMGQFAAHSSLLAPGVDDEVRARSVVRLDVDRGFLDAGYRRVCCCCPSRATSTSRSP